MEAIEPTLFIAKDLAVKQKDESKAEQPSEQKSNPKTPVKVTKPNYLLRLL